MVKQQDSKVESFNYESGILPLPPNFFRYIGPYNVYVQNNNISNGALVAML